MYNVHVLKGSLHLRPFHRAYFENMTSCRGFFYNQADVISEAIKEPCISEKKNLTNKSSVNALILYQKCEWKKWKRKLNSSFFLLYTYCRTNCRKLSPMVSDSIIYLIFYEGKEKNTYTQNIEYMYLLFSSIVLKTCMLPYARFLKLFLKIQLTYFQMRSSNSNKWRK